jgi:hypothetical protein
LLLAKQRQELLQGSDEDMSKSSVGGASVGEDRLSLGEQMEERAEIVKRLQDELHNLMETGWYSEDDPIIDALKEELRKANKAFASMTQI